LEIIKTLLAILGGNKNTKFPPHPCPFLAPKLFSLALFNGLRRVSRHAGATPGEKDGEF
jgi:hypothetical protein